MEKGDASVLAQLLTGMKEACGKLKKAYEDKDMEGLSAAKKEITNLQKEVDNLL